MSGLKRWELYYCVDVIEADDGEYVLYEDVKDPLAERGAMLSLLKDIRRQLDKSFSGQVALGEDLYRELCATTDEDAEPGMTVSDEPIDPDYAIRIASLWKAGKMIGGDENEVRDTLLGEVERLRAEIEQLRSAARQLIEASEADRSTSASARWVPKWALHKLNQLLPEKAAG